VIKGWRSLLTYLLLCLSLGAYVGLFDVAQEWGGFWGVLLIALVVFSTLLIFVTARDRDLKEKSNLRAD